MSLVHCKDLEHFKKLINDTKPCVVDFYADWCGPCKMIAPRFEELSRVHSNVAFVKVNVDEAQSIAAHCAIRSMPTFHFYKNGHKVDEMIGADPSGLEQKIKKLL